MMKYKVIFQETEKGFAVSALGLPGCHSQGTTEEEALENITAAIREYLAVREELLKAEMSGRDVEVEV
jgi:predicted RNase H-like HicB family nuclease